MWAWQVARGDSFTHVARGDGFIHVARVDSFIEVARGDSFIQVAKGDSFIEVAMVHPHHVMRRGHGPACGVPEGASQAVHWELWCLLLCKATCPHSVRCDKLAHGSNVANAAVTSGGSARAATRGHVARSSSSGGSTLLAEVPKGVEAGMGVRQHIQGHAADHHDVMAQLIV